MNTFEEFLVKIENIDNRNTMASLLNWISDKYPKLDKRIAWNQPMFTNEGTFIIGFSVSKNHIAVAPERAGIVALEDDIKKSGYQYAQMIVRFPWNKPINYELLGKMIDFNIADKKGLKTFWRK